MVYYKDKSQSLHNFIEYNLDELAINLGYKSAKHMARTRDQNHISLYWRTQSILVDKFVEKYGVVR